MIDGELMIIDSMSKTAAFVFLLLLIRRSNKNRWFLFIEIIGAETSDGPRNHRYLCDMWLKR